MKRPFKCCGVQTYEHQVCIPLNGKVQCIDFCLHHIVAALNAGGVTTTMCCCGHGERDGHIILADGRVLTVVSSLKKWKSRIRKAGKQ